MQSFLLPLRLRRRLDSTYSPRSALALFTCVRDMPRRGPLIPYFITGAGGRGYQTMGSSGSSESLDRISQTGLTRIPPPPPPFIRPEKRKKCSQNLNKPPNSDTCLRHSSTLRAPRTAPCWPRENYARISISAFSFCPTSHPPPALPREGVSDSVQGVAKVT